VPSAQAKAEDRERGRRATYARLLLFRNVARRSRDIGILMANTTDEPSEEASATVDAGLPWCRGRYAETGGGR